MFFEGVKGRWIERFGARGPDAKWPPSPVFGAISGRSWGVLQDRHLDPHSASLGG